jgi:hypothetical protein
LVSCTGLSSPFQVDVLYLAEHIHVINQTLKNKHYLATLSNTICLTALVIGPLASSYFYLDVPPDGFATKLDNVTSLDSLGLQGFGTLADFDSAAGFMRVRVPFLSVLFLV